MMVCAYNSVISFRLERRKRIYGYSTDRWCLVVMSPARRCTFEPSLARHNSPNSEPIYFTVYSRTFTASWTRLPAQILSPRRNTCIQQSQWQQQWHSITTHTLAWLQVQNTRLIYSYLFIHDVMRRWMMNAWDVCVRWMHDSGTLA